MKVVLMGLIVLGSLMGSSVHASFCSGGAKPFTTKAISFKNVKYKANQSLSVSVAREMISDSKVKAFVSCVPK